MKKTNNYTYGLLGVLSAVLTVAVWVALYMCIANYSNDENSSEGLGLAIIVLITLPLMVADGVFAAVILGLSAGAFVCGTKKFNKALIISLAVFEIIAGVSCAAASLLLLNFVVYLLIFLIAAAVCIASAVFTLVSANKLSRQPHDSG